MAFGLGRMGGGFGRMGGSARSAFTFRSAKAAAVVAAMTVKPSLLYMQRYDDLGLSIEMRGLFTKLKLLYVFADLHEQTQAPKINWVDPSLFLLTAVGAGLTYGSDGAVGNASNQAANTGFIPGTHGAGIFALNSSHIGIFFATLPAQNTVDVGAGTDYLNGLSAAGALGGKLQAAGANNASSNNAGIGHKCIVRVNATTVRFYHLGRKLGNDVTQNSSALSTEALYIGGQNVAGVLTLPSNKKYRAVHIGSGGTDWTATETAQMQAALGDFFVPVEATADSQSNFFVGASIEGGGVGAIDRNGYIYVCGIATANGDTLLVKVDKTTRKIVERFTLSTLYPSDVHMCPTVGFLPDGRLIVAYTGHLQDGVIRFRRASGARLSTLGNEVAVSALTETTYTRFFQTSTAGVLYILSRELLDSWEIYKSTDYGDTWTRKKRPIAFGGLQSYVTTPTNAPVDNSVLICLAWSHPDNLRNPLCVFTWDRSTDTIQDASGVKGTLNDATVTSALLTYGSMTPIYTPPVGKSHAVYTSTADGLAYILQEYDNSTKANVKYFLVTRNAGGGTVYEAGGWTFTEITGLARATAFPAGAGGISFDARSGLSGLAFYISRESGGTYTIERWTSSDNGASWGTHVVATSASKLFRPLSPLDGDGTIPVLWALGTYVDFDSISTTAHWEAG